MLVYSAMDRLIGSISRESIAISKWLPSLSITVRNQTPAAGVDGSAAPGPRGRAVRSTQVGLTATIRLSLSVPAPSRARSPGRRESTTCSGFAAEGCSATRRTRRRTALRLTRLRRSPSRCRRWPRRCSCRRRGRSPHARHCAKRVNQVAHRRPSGGTVAVSSISPSATARSIAALRFVTPNLR